MAEGKIEHTDAKVACLPWFTYQPLSACAAGKSGFNSCCMCVCVRVCVCDVCSEFISKRRFDIYEFLP